MGYGADIMDPTSILQAAEEVILLSLGGSDDERSVCMRLELVAERHPEFAEKYPKLLTVCVSATTSAKAEGVRRFLPMMIDQLRGIDGGTSTFEDASKTVGVVLGEHFLPAKGE